MTSQKIKTIFSFLYLAIFPFLIIYSLELMNVKFTIGNASILLLAGLMIMLVMLFIYSIINNVFITGLIVTIILFIFYLGNSVVQNYTGFVLLPADLVWITRLNQLTGFAGDIQISVKLEVLALILAELVLLFVVNRFLILKIDKKKRIIMIASSILCFFMVFFSGFSKNFLLPLFHINVEERYTANYLYHQQGVLMGFYVSFLQSTNSINRANYDEEFMEEILADIKRIAENDVEDTKSLANIQPNVIVIMSESFCDPTKWGDITFSEDPIPNFHELSEKYTSGTLVVPVIGGGTCNVEYEFLTGNSAVNFDNVSRIFEDYEKTIPNIDPRSLPVLFKRNGYKTIEVHPYEKTFYNRDKIYPRLGFDEFIALEDMIDSVYKGEYVSDAYFTDQIIDVIEKTEEPLFLYGVSMQNHVPYLSDKYEKFGGSNITGESSLLDDNLTQRMNAYLQGTNDADRELQRLINHIEEAQKPTILIFFGDHIPLIGVNGVEFYNLLGTGDYELYNTNYLIWDNINLEKKYWGDISPYFLGALVADQIGIELNLYYKYLLYAYENYHALNQYIYVDSENVYYDAPSEEAIIQIINQLSMIHYDKIFGKQYIDAALGEMAP